jgi:hypothetical protein
VGCVPLSHPDPDPDPDPGTTPDQPDPGDSNPPGSTNNGSDTLWNPNNNSTYASAKNASSFQQCVPTPGHPCQESNTGPNWYKIGAGVLLGIAIVADYVVVVSVAAIPEVDTLLVYDAIVEGFPLTSMLIFINVEPFVLILDGINGR